MQNRNELRKKAAYENGKNPNIATQKDYLFQKGLLQTRQVFSHCLRRADMDCTVFDGYTVEVDSLELLVGRPSLGFVLTDETEREKSEAERILTVMGKNTGAFQASTGHRVIDYEKLLHTGIDGVLAEIEERRARLSYTDADYAEKYGFYTASMTSLQGVLRFARRCRRTLLSHAAAETDERRKAELIAMADNFENAPRLPCTHFYEALQCMWFMQFCLWLVNDISLTGRLDAYLYPFYEKDLADGFITKEFAFTLLEELYYKHNELYDRWPASLMVGGFDRAGNRVCNELTYLCLEAIRTTGLVNPSVSIAYTEDMPDDLLRLCVELLSEGCTRPAIFNDRIVREGLMAAGVSEEDARSYIHSTCVEITPVAASHIRVATPYININKAFEYVLGGKKQIFGDDCHVEREIDFSPEDLQSFDRFTALLLRVTAEIIRSYLHEVIRTCHLDSRYASAPLSSAFINDCLARGLDTGAGGARYAFVYPCFPGFINFIDALSAIKTAVYDEKIVTLAELGEALRGNFSDSERIRQYLLNRCEKFGNDESTADAIGVMLYEFLRAELKKYKTCVGVAFHPSFFAWIMHGQLGKKTAATPDGRKQGEALSEHLGSVQGMDRNGPTAVMRSIGKLDQKYGIGGIATNFRFTRDMLADEKGKQALCDFIRVFMQNGNFEIQLNVAGNAELLAARKNPERYKTLLVRVAGYSDYYVNLAHEIQDEILKRSEHSGF